jgi:fused signal recognition particle receptor
MFDELRKKLSNAVKGFIKKEEQKEEIKEPEPAIEEQPSAENEIIEKDEPQPVVQPEKVEEKEPEPVMKEKPVALKVTIDEPKPIAVKEIARESPKEKEHSHQKREEIIKLSLKTKIKGAILGTVKLSEPEIENFLEVLKVSMLESDVSFDTTEQFVDDLHLKLQQKQINSRKIREEITQTVRSSLFSVLYNGNAIDVDNFVKQHKESNETPVKILFLGPNGAGKTTTVAKMAYHFKNKGVTNVLAAGDTFRAAAIEQIEHHAKKIGVPVIKSTYGADPASIAFDAIAYAKAHSIDLVLIDSAGRQETNKSLIHEVQKIVRIAKPDITVFVGESTAGNQISEQIKEFNKFVKIDGIILTKLDCDAKGGGALSISHTTGIPILFFGVGEEYSAIIPYNPNYIVDAILPENN